MEVFTEEMLKNERKYKIFNTINKVQKKKNSAENVETLSCPPSAILKLIDDDL